MITSQRHNIYIMSQPDPALAASACSSYADPLDPLVFLVFPFLNLLLANLKCIIITSLLVWGILELFFFVYMKDKIFERLRPPREPLKPLSCQRELIFRVIDILEKLRGVYSVQEFIGGFFLGATIEQIQRDNLCSFLAWAMYSVHLQDISLEQALDVDLCCDEFCKRHNILLKPGRNPSVRHIDMTLADLPYWHRPLFMYVAAAVMELFGNSVYRLAGFIRLEMNGVTYWFRSGSAASGTPVLFFHGVCVGWLSYFQLVRNVGRNKTMLLVDLNPIKILSLSFEMPSSDRYCSTVKKILSRHAIERVNVIGHSFGTITAGWFCKHFPGSVAHLTLLDPVCLLLGLPAVAHSFLYRYPTTFVQWAIFLFAATDPTLSHTLYRHFWWYRNVLWFEDIPHNLPVVIGIAGRDEVNNARALLKYSTELTNRDKLSAPIEVIHWPEFSHAQILVSIESQRALSDVIKRSER